MSEQDDIDRYRYLQLKAKAAQEEQIEEPKKEKRDLFSKGGLKVGDLGSLGSDIAKGVGYGLMEDVVGIPNLASTAHNVLRPNEATMKNIVENPMPKPETPYGNVASLASSIFAPATIVRGASMLSKPASVAGEFLTGIPGEIYEFALKSPKVLKGKFDKHEEYDKAAQIARKAYEDMLSRKGGNVGAAKLEALVGKSAKKEIPETIAQNVEKMATPYAGRTAEEVGGLIGKEASLVKEVASMLKPIKEVKTSKILSEAGKPITQETVKQSTVQQLANAQRRVRESIASWGEGSGNEFLKNMDELLTNELKNRVPGYRKAMSEYETFQDYISEAGKGSLKPENIERTLKNIGSKTLRKQGAFQEITGIPDETMKELAARDLFNQWMPGRGYTTGQDQGPGNIFRAFALGAMPTTPGKIGLATAFSPKAHATMIKALPNIGALAKYAAPVGGIEEILRKRGNQ